MSYISRKSFLNRLFGIYKIIVDILLSIKSRCQDYDYGLWANLYNTNLASQQDTVSAS